MKKDHKSALDLSFGVHTGEIKLKGKREAYKGENSAAPCNTPSRESVQYMIL